MANSEDPDKITPTGSIRFVQVYYYGIYNSKKSEETSIRLSVVPSASNSRYLVCTTPTVFFKLYRCFSICHDLKMCIWFGYTPQINFCHFFFRILNLVIFQARILSKGIDSGYLVCVTPPTDLC